ncbi:MAG TPA: TusE/DsrC/DsvC family sulfur relay protein [Thioploca sp.]|nr:MAG: hypothetical protein B6247_28515 [Beggiatoa sp. 4572_84]RKZ54113.1 MAG: sulfurtransferase TusE [Gammaproteobacteria bacterium]HDN26367.1 TusE/DsrC/DsvC family sulfur relay protein [Thioploca sp.]
MGIEVQGKTIETDTNGYLVNQRDWSQEVAMKLAAAEKIDMTETHWGLIEAVRQFSDENKQQVSMIDLIHLLSKHLKETPYEARRDIDNFLYQLFPNGPDKQLAKIAGLPQPVPAE